MCTTQCQEESGDEGDWIHALEKFEHFVWLRKWCSVRVELWGYGAEEEGKEQTCAFSADGSDYYCSTHERCWGYSGELPPGVGSPRDDSYVRVAFVDVAGPLLVSVACYQVGAAAALAAVLVGEHEASESGSDR